jgi:Mg-chelatase subunit ChlD
MTQEDIIKLAREAGLAEGIADGLNGEWKAEREFLERFAELVAAHEREACANLLLNVDLSSMDADHRLQRWTATVLLNFSDAIRARGER